MNLPTSSSPGLWRGVRSTPKRYSGERGHPPSKYASQKPGSDSWHLFFSPLPIPRQWLRLVIYLWKSPGIHPCLRLSAPCTLIPATTMSIWSEVPNWPLESTTTPPPVPPPPPHRQTISLLSSQGPRAKHQLGRSLSPATLLLGWRPKPSRQPRACAAWPHWPLQLVCHHILTQSLWLS